MHRLPLEIIRAQRDGHPPTAEDLQAVVDGLCSGQWSEGQVAAWAMAVLWRGLPPASVVDLTQAMVRSGTVLQWPDIHQPVLDKHSTGGVGDKVSLILAPLWAACGAVVPMISGRGLGHTGGTLDKLEAIPGFAVQQDAAAMRRALLSAGCCIVSAGADLAPADRRLYAIRDVTATVESIALITASILSKKLAAGLQALVMDVKFGQGAFLPDTAQAQALADRLVAVAAACGLPTRALLTDMNQVLGDSAGNAVEVAESLRVLRGAPLGPATQRLQELTLTLAAEGLVMTGLEPNPAAARARALEALTTGHALEHWERMLRAQGVDRTTVDRLDAALPQAPVRCPVPALQSGTVLGHDVRALGLLVVRLGGGRTRPDAPVDPSVGVSELLPPGAAVLAGAPLAWVHARSQADAEAAVQAIQQALPVA